MHNFKGSPVLRFAEKMQDELDNNSHKSGYSGCPMHYLIKRLKQETAELAKAIELNKPIEKVISECADVANFAMMIANNYENDLTEKDMEEIINEKK